MSADLYRIADPAFWLKVVFCIFCGTIVGLERQINKKPIEIRTSVLICLGTMTFVYLGVSLGGEQDPTRVLGQVVTGIGFLGGGVIMKTREGLIGLTSASVVWVLAAIGCAIALDHYMVGLVIAVLTVLLLVTLHWVDDLGHLKKP